MTGTALSPALAWKQDAKFKNWAGNFEFSTDKLYYPETVEAAREFIKKTPRVKALGTRHCFNRIADSKDQLISSEKLNIPIALDKEANTITAPATIKYGQLCPYLHENGYALHNLASLPHISVTGACATATHGSGDKNGNLSTAVSAIEFISADGELVTLSKKQDAEKFNGTVVGLGTLGLVTKITLNVQPTFLMKCSGKAESGSAEDVSVAEGEVFREFLSSGSCW